MQHRVSAARAGQGPVALLSALILGLCNQLQRIVEHPATWQCWSESVRSTAHSSGARTPRAPCCLARPGQQRPLRLRIVQQVAHSHSVAAAIADPACISWVNHCCA